MGTSMSLLLQDVYLESVPTQLFVLFIESQEQKHKRFPPPPPALEPGYEMLPQALSFLQPGTKLPKQQMQAQGTQLHSLLLALERCLDRQTMLI